MPSALGEAEPRLLSTRLRFVTREYGEKDALSYARLQWSAPTKSPAARNASRAALSASLAGTWGGGGGAHLRMSRTGDWWMEH